MEREFASLMSCVTFLSQINPELPVGVDKENITKPGKAIGIAESRITTCLNFMYGKWFYSLKGKPREWKQYAVKEAFHLGDPVLIRNRQAKLNSLALIYSRVPPDAWTFEKFWSWYEKLARLWVEPFKQREFISRSKESGIEGELSLYLSTIEKKPRRQRIKTVNKKLKPEYIIVNKNTGEIKEDNLWEALEVVDLQEVEWKSEEKSDEREE